MRALAIVVLVGACASGCAEGEGVRLTLTFADDVDDATLAAVSALQFSATGDETYDQVLPLGRAAQRVERVAYRPAKDTRQLTVEVRALDAAQLVLADGATPQLELATAAATSAAVLLERHASPALDLSAAIDLAGADLVSYDGGPISCPPAAILCDGFESGDTSRWTDTSVQAPATLAVDSLMPFRGSYSLDTHMTMTGASSYASVGFDFTSSADVVSARAYVLAPTAPGNYPAIVALHTAAGYFTVATDQNNHWTVTEAGPDHTSGILMPLGKWNCVELVVDYSGGGNGHVRLYANSTLLVDFVPAKARSPFTSLQVGQPRAAGNVDARVFIDEVALAPGMIGCQ